MGPPSAVAVVRATPSTKLLNPWSLHCVPQGDYGGTELQPSKVGGWRHETNWDERRVAKVFGVFSSA